MYREFIKLFSCFPRMYQIITIVSVPFAIPFYAFMLFVLFKSRNDQRFNGVFYRLVLILGVLDLLSIVHTYFFLKFPEVGNNFVLDFYMNVFDLNLDKNLSFSSSKQLHNFGRNEQCPPSFRCVFLAWYGYFSLLSIGMCQNIGITMTSLNRFTALAFSIRLRYLQHKVPSLKSPLLRYYL